MMAIVQETWLFVQANREAFTLGGLAFTVLVLGWLARRAVKGGRPDKWLAAVAVLLGFGWSGEAMWEVATQILELTAAFALLGFLVFETQLGTAMMRAERHQKVHKHPGRYGRTAWLTAAVMGGIAAMAGDTWVERALRMAVPLLVIKQWWDGLVGDDGVRRRSGATTWRWTPRRLALKVGAIEAGERDVETIDRERRIADMTHLEHRRRHGSRRLRSWRARRLANLSLVADDEMVAEVRRRVRRAQWFAGGDSAPAETDAMRLADLVRRQSREATDRGREETQRTRNLRLFSLMDATSVAATDGHVVARRSGITASLSRLINGHGGGTPAATTTPGPAPAATPPVAATAPPPLPPEAPPPLPPRPRQARANDTAGRVARYVAANPRATAAQVAAQLDVSVRTVQRYMPKNTDHQED